MLMGLLNDKGGIDSLLRPRPAVIASRINTHPLENHLRFLWEKHHKNNIDPLPSVDLKHLLLLDMGLLHGHQQLPHDSPQNQHDHWLEGILHLVD